MLQLACAMEHVHAVGYMHRDLKPSNILLHGSTIKVCDFGLACLRPAQKASLTAETGSYRWMAPEVMRHEPYDEKCDIYSFGFVCWSLLTRSPPFPALTSVEAAFAVADEAKRPRMPDCPADLGALLERAWAQESEERPSFEEVVGQLALMVEPASPPEPSPSTQPARTTLPVALPQPSSATGVGGDGGAFVTGVGGNVVTTPVVAIDISQALQLPRKLSRSPPGGLHRELSGFLGEMDVLTLTQSAVTLGNAAG